MLPSVRLFFREKWKKFLLISLRLIVKERPYYPPPQHKTPAVVIQRNVIVGIFALWREETIIYTVRYTTVHYIMYNLTGCPVSTHISGFVSRRERKKEPQTNQPTKQTQKQTNKNKNAKNKNTKRNQTNGKKNYNTERELVLIPSIFYRLKLCPYLIRCD